VNDIIVSQKVSQYIPPGYPVEIFLSSFSQTPSLELIKLTNDTVDTNASYINIRSQEYSLQYILIQKSINPYFSFYFKSYDMYVKYQQSLSFRGYIDNLTRSPSNPAPTATFIP
jgi:hypothetical protein